MSILPACACGTHADRSIHVIRRPFLIPIFAFSAPLRESIPNPAYPVHPCTFSPNHSPFLCPLCFLWPITLPLP